MCAEPRVDSLRATYGIFFLANVDVRQVDGDYRGEDQLFQECDMTAIALCG